MPRSRGFTLIELLITVSIVALIATIGIMSYVSFLKQSRDSKRQSDLKTIQSVLEQYHSDQHFYPPSKVTITGQSFTNATGRTGIVVTKTYLNNSPREDWVTLSPYIYEPLPSDCTESGPPICNNYCLYAKLEGVSPGLGNCVAKTNYNFAVSQP
jgi:prepilin-type N-terminal cleavage/methylation domain-containing protein